jgi:hypothetical protein
MDVFEEISENSESCQAHPLPPPQTPVALDQLLATHNALMQKLVANEERREACEQQQ